MVSGRIERHPIVTREQRRTVRFTFAGREMTAFEGETISSALMAHGVRVFGHHPRDGSPQGLYCANGQCSQCMVIADGRPVKACMTPVDSGMCVDPLDQLPELPPAGIPPETYPVETRSVPVLILGGGPAGMSAAIELARHNVEAILVDDKDRLGGKLVLQTHRFFGSMNAVYAGTRGIDIGERLANDVASTDSIEVWLDSTALAVFADRKVGVLKEGCYVLVEPQILLVSTGARERSLVFQGNTLPGVFGAGAFQTLVNRDLVRVSERLFIVGGGNVGLIAGYHALQAEIDVVGLVEALPKCGGYKVHRDKLARMGVPIHTSHTVLSANGRDGVESITIARIDEKFRPIANTERSFACDTVLIAVGLDPVDEFLKAGEAVGLPTYAAGDAEEIAEASAAIFSGKIRGLEIAHALGATEEDVPAEWLAVSEILRSKPGRSLDRATRDAYLVTSFESRAAEDEADTSGEGVFPVFHCSQEIPCNPCTSVCPQGLIHIDEEDIRAMPEFLGPELGRICVGCERCVTICPGLAITLVDARENQDHPIVTIPFEYRAESLSIGDEVLVLDAVGEPVGSVPVVEVKAIPTNDRTVLVKVRAPAETATRIAGIRIQEPWVGEPLPETVEPMAETDIVCRCERVAAGEIRALIRAGYRDVNEIKAVTRAGMGACGGKTCQALISRLFREEGVPLDQVTENVSRPLFVEVPFSILGRMRSRGGA